jgi:membrane protein required for colicin V production
LNLLDIAIGLLCVGFTLSGLLKGLVRQAAGWAGLILGHLAGLRFHGLVQRTFELEFPKADVVAYLITFVAVYFAARVVGSMAERRVRGSRLSGADRATGGAAGLLKGVLLSILLVFVTVVFVPRDAQFLRSSKLLPKVIGAARWMAPAFPDKVRQAFEEKLR